MGRYKKISGQKAEPRRKPQMEEKQIDSNDRGGKLLRSSV